MAEPALPPRFSPPPRPLTLLRAFWRMLRGADDMEMVPQTAYEEFLVEQPVLFGPRVFYATGPEETRRLLVENAANYHKSLLTRRILGPGLREGLILAEDEVWRRQRRAIAPLFQPRVFEGYAAAMTRAGAELAEAWAGAPGGIVRASEGTARATYDVIMATLFGVFLFSEPLSAMQILGGALIVGGGVSQIIISTKKSDSVVEAFTQEKTARKL